MGKMTHENEPIPKKEMERICDKERDSYFKAIPEVDYTEYQHDAGHKGGD